MIKAINYTSQFKKDIDKAKRQNRNLKTLQYVIELLATNSTLPIKFKDHKLMGNYKGRRECHLEPDFLLIYLIKEDELYLERMGTHSELFK
jgi:mRNA interferase YafQ